VPPVCCRAPHNCVLTVVVRRGHCILTVRSSPLNDLPRHPRGALACARTCSAYPCLCPRIVLLQIITRMSRAANAGPHLAQRGYPTSRGAQEQRARGPTPRAATEHPRHSLQLPHGCVWRRHAQAWRAHRPQARDRSPSHAACFENHGLVVPVGAKVKVAVEAVVVLDVRVTVCHGIRALASVGHVHGLRAGRAARYTGPRLAAAGPAKKRGARQGFGARRAHAGWRRTSELASDPPCGQSSSCQRARLSAAVAPHAMPARCEYHRTTTSVQRPGHTSAGVCARAACPGAASLGAAAHSHGPAAPTAPSPV